MINMLKQISYFKNINRKVINELIGKGKITKHFYNKGMTIHEQNTKSSGIDIVWEGKLIAYSLTINGSETIVSEFSKNDIIGANLLFGDENRYPMNIYCLEDSILFHIEKTAIEELLKIHGFVIEFIRSLSLNSQGMNKKIVMYTQKTLRENLLDYLRALSASQNSQVVALPITKKELADRLGVQRPSLFRELKQMKDEGLIDIDNRIITLKK